MYDLIEKSDILVRNLPGAGYFKQEKESSSMNASSKKDDHMGYKLSGYIWLYYYRSKLTQW